MGKPLLFGFLVVVPTLAIVEMAGCYHGLAGEENTHYDLGHQLAGRRYRPKPMIIVAIDEQTRLKYQDEPLVFWPLHFAQALKVLKKRAPRSSAWVFFFR